MSKQNRKPNRQRPDKDQKRRPRPNRVAQADKKDVRVEQQSEDFVVGKHAVLETLKSDRDINKLFLQEKKFKRE